MDGNAATVVTSTWATKLRRFARLVHIQELTLKEKQKITKINIMKPFLTTKEGFSFAYALTASINFPNTGSNAAPYQ